MAVSINPKAVLRNFRNLASPFGSALIGFLQSGTGAVARTAQDKMRDVVSIKDFGAVGDGVADDTTARANAIATGKLVLIPKGAYRFSGVTWTFTTDHLLGILRIGDRDYNNSDDPQVLVARDVDSNVVGNGHCFSDSSKINRPGTISYNSFDARISVSGSENYGHYAAFQVGPTFNGTGTFDNLFAFISAPTMTAGTITNNYGLHMTKPVLSGSADVLRTVGVYFGPTWTEYTGAPSTLRTNYVILNESPMRMSTLGQLHAKKIFISPTDGTMTKDFHLNSNGDVEVMARWQQQGYNTWDLGIPASQIYFSFFGNGTERYRFMNNGTFKAPTDNTQDVGASTERWANGFFRQVRPGAGAVIWTSGAGTPEGSVTAPVGSLYTRTDGGAGTTLYVKESGSGNTGWVGK